jgi:hypothetical protein
MLGGAAVFAVALANAQSAASSLSISGAPAFSAAAESSSLETADAALPADSAAEPAGPSAAAGGAGQQYGHKQHQSLVSKLTFEAGGGFNAPIGNDTNQSGVLQSPVGVITWGGNFTGGGGLRFNKWVSVLGEYQFMDNKLPGALIAGINNATGGVDDITAGNAHINAITASPVIDITPKRSNGVYAVGGWGFYHKSTNFQAPELAISYYGEYYENVTVASFTSNQWGGNLGFGIYHRLGGGVYGGGDSKTKLFAEARYTFLHTPPATQANGLGTTELIPVTVGIRF